MPTIIYLTDVEGDIYVNASHIVTMTDYGEGTEIRFIGGHVIHVKEDMDTVTDKIYRKIHTVGREFYE